MIDLHTHSTASDGTYSPKELVQLAAEKNISILALTDHDCYDGLIEAQEEAKAQKIQFIPGIEISIDWPKGEFHLLGLGLKKPSAELKNLTEFLQNDRESRNRKMAEKLNEFGINFDYDEFIEFWTKQKDFNIKTLGRPHFAQFLKEKGIVKTAQTAFDKYLAKGRPCYIEKSGANLNEAILAVTTSGGIPVMAHPLSIYVSWGKIEDTMKTIKNAGILGLEAYHPGIRYGEAVRLEELAVKLGLIFTGGSDFHGEKIRADRKLGWSAGKRKIEDRIWDTQLKPQLEQLHEGCNHNFTL